MDRHARKSDELKISKVVDWLNENFGGNRSVEIDGDPYTGTRVLANEWDAFPVDFIGPLQEYGIIFATILREPLDRALSMYNFFHAEVHPPGDKDHQTLMRFRAYRGELNNYYVRKLTEGDSTTSSYLSMRQDIWEWDFELAKEVLSQFHFLLILEYLTKYGQEPFDFIGWKFDDSRRNAAPRQKHRSTSNAVAELEQDVIRVLIQENYYDILLYQYAVQLFVERKNGCASIST